MRTRKLLAFVGLACTLLFGGCSKSSSTAETPANQNAAVKEGGSIVVGVQQDVDILDPHLSETAGTREILFNLFEGLVKPTSEGEMKPAVAEKYEISEDGSVYTFTLRDGVKFHNGETVTADDVVYSLQRAAGLLPSDLGNVLDSDLKNVDSVERKDDKTVVVTLKSADTEFLAYMTTAILPKDYDNQAKAPIGTGPFKFKSYTPQESLVIEKNNDYYGTKAHLDQVTFKIIADADSSVLLALQGGNIDIYPYLTADQAAQLKEGFSIEVGSTNLVQALFLNNDVEPFNDARVRQALCYLVNKKEIIDGVFGGYGNPIGTGVFPSFKTYYDASLENAYETNVDKAKELLKEAGLEKGFEMTITVPSNYQPHMDTAQVIVEQLKKAGINAKIDPIEWASWVSDVYVGRKYQSTVIGLDADLAPKALLARYESESTKNFVNFKSEAYDVAIKAAMGTTDANEKIEKYKECQQILSKEAASVYIQDPASLVAVSKKLSGYTFYPLYVQDMSLVYYVQE